MTDAQSILQVITLAVTGWVLIEVIKLKTTMAAIKQQIKDFPCQKKQTCSEV
jgi:hypothetical protein